MRTEPLVLQGGLDLTTQVISKNAGTLIACSNYEAADGGGYSRIEGYERFSGLPAPTDASYSTISFNAGGNEPAIGDSVLGLSSAATGKILALIVQSGSWVGNDAAGYFVLTKITGTWQDGEGIRDSGDTLTVATSSSVEQINLADSFELHKAYLSLAREDYRNDISTVAGSGKIRGVWMYDGYVYAFRDNIGGTECKMFKSSSSGWAEQDLGIEVEFTTGSTLAPSEGLTVTGSTSGATGLLVDHSMTDGSFETNDATGRLHIEAVTGTFQNETITFSGGSVVATANTANTLDAGGRFEFVNYNFKGQASSSKMYGCDGVNKAFQWDGTGFAFIHTKAAIDKPSHIAAHRFHLFLGLQSTVQHSAVGIPLSFEVDEGASEIATGDAVTGFLSLPKGSLAIFSRSIIHILYGSSADIDGDTWDLQLFSPEAGAIEHTCQNMGDTPKYFDDRGMTSIQVVQEYGNFKKATLSKHIDTLVKSKKKMVLSSTRIREKDEYRLFFTDNTGIVMRYVEGIGESFTIIEFPVSVECVSSVEDTDGTERVFFGSEDGYIYEMEKGDSFDGSDIEYRMALSFSHMKAPRHYKRFFSAHLDIETKDKVDLKVLPDFSYGDPDIPSSVQYDAMGIRPSGGVWDTQDIWGDFYWDGVHVAQADIDMDGEGISLSLMIQGASNFEAPHRIHDGYVNWELRRLKR